MKRWEWLECIADHTPEDMPPDVHHLLLTLVRFADDDGRCWPSHEKLAEVMKVHVTTVPRRIRRAVASGWLVVDHLGRWKGDPSHYHLTPQGCPHALKAPHDAGLRDRTKALHQGRHSPARRSSKPRTTQTERIERSNEGAGGAPIVMAHLAPLASNRCAVCGRDFLGDAYDRDGAAVCSWRCRDAQPAEVHA